jgi:hypothetical protein
MEQSEDWFSNQHYLDKQVLEEEPVAIQSNALISAQVLAT